MEILALLVLGSASVVVLALLLRTRRDPAAPPARSSVTAPVLTGLSVDEFVRPEVAARLRAAGIRTARDLVLAEGAEGVDAVTFGHARLLARLISIPNVGREEAALLAACGVVAPEDLLATPAPSLARRLNEANRDLAVLEGSVAPGEVRQWAESVRAGRALPGGSVPGPLRA